MYPASEGISTAARIAMITRTIITSTSVKPFFFFKFLRMFFIAEISFVVN